MPGYRTIAISISRAYVRSPLARRTKSRRFLPSPSAGLQGSDSIVSDAMRRVVIVAYAHATALDVIGPAEAFSSAAERLGKDGYRVELASVGGGERRTTASVGVATRDLLRLRPLPDDIVVVAGGGEAAVT